MAVSVNSPNKGSSSQMGDGASGLGCKSIDFANATSCAM
jgi:hypothetical protein